MDSRHLRAIILKLQDRLSDDDRRRLHFFLGNDVPRRFRDDPTLGGTLCLMESLFDQDKINEQDFSFLINAFDEIQCIDAVKLLREHLRRMQSNDMKQSIQSLATIMPHTLDLCLQDNEEDKLGFPNVFIDEKNDLASYNTITTRKNCYDNNTMVMNSDMTKINSEPAAVNSRTSMPSPLKQNELSKESSKSKKYLLIFVVLSGIVIMALVGLIVGIILVKSELKSKALRCLQEQVKNNETVQHLIELQKRSNETIDELTKKTKDLEEQLRKRQMGDNEMIEKLIKKTKDQEEKLQITIGTTCGCQQWCKENMQTHYGVCGDGHTCICRQQPITKDGVGDGCTCEAWCQKSGYKNGGICGDGYTCLCSS